MPGEDCFDETALKKLRGLGGAEFLEKMIGLFLENAPRRVATARAGLLAGDLKAVELAAHSLRSIAGNLGARDIQALAARIERLAESAQGEGISALLDKLEPALAVMMARLEEVIGKSQGKGGGPRVAF